MSRRLGLAPLIGLLVSIALVLSACDPVGGTASAPASTAAATAAVSPTTATPTTTLTPTDRSALEQKAREVCGAATIRSCKDRGEIAYKAIPADRITTDATALRDQLVTLSNEGDWVMLTTAVDLVTKLQAAFDASKQSVAGTDSNGGKVVAPVIPANNLAPFNGEQTNANPLTPPVVAPTADRRLASSWTEIDSWMKDESWYWECGKRTSSFDHSTDMPNAKALEAQGTGMRFILVVNSNVTDEQAREIVRAAGNKEINDSLPIIRVHSFLNTRGLKNHGCEEYVDSTPQVRVGMAKPVQLADGSWRQDPYSGFALESCLNWDRLLHKVAGEEVGPKRPTELPPPPPVIWDECPDDQYPAEPGNQPKGHLCSKDGTVGSIGSGAHDPQGGTPDPSRNPVTAVETSRPVVVARATASASTSTAVKTTATTVVSATRTTPPPPPPPSSAPQPSANLCPTPDPANPNCG